MSIFVHYSRKFGKEKFKRRIFINSESVIFTISFGSFKIGQFFKTMKDLNQTGHDLGNHLLITKNITRIPLISKITIISALLFIAFDVIEM